MGIISFYIMYVTKGKVIEFAMYIIQKHIKVYEYC